MKKNKLIYELEDEVDYLSRLAVLCRRAGFNTAENYIHEAREAIKKALKSAKEDFRNAEDI